jgi:hypothetical protein
MAITGELRNNPPIVIFDVAHNQQFNNTHLTSALEMIEDLFSADIIINEDNFTLTNIRGADLIIIPSPTHPGGDISSNDLGPFTEYENRALQEYWEDGGSLMFLANPYFFEPEYQNLSSANTYLNNMMKASDDSPDYESLSFVGSKGVLVDDFNYIYSDERFLHLTNKTFLNSHPIIRGATNEDVVNEVVTSMTFTSPPSTANPSLLINTSNTAYELDEDGRIKPGSIRSHALLSADAKYRGRGLSVASGIMFSDLNITGTETSWFDALDNSKLWKNMLSWLLFKIPKTTPVSPLPNFGYFGVAILVVFFVFMVFGSVFYTVGREVKRAEVSEVLTQMRKRRLRKEELDEEIEEAVSAEEEEEEEEMEEEEEEIVSGEVDMQSISDEVKKKPPKTRSRSERRRRRRED